MTKTKIALFAIPTCVLLIAIGALSVNFAETDLVSNSDNSYSIQNEIIPQAYAEKPVQAIVPIDLSSTDYGASSTFDIEKVECKISTKGGVTTVNWCKATLIQDKVVFGACFDDFELCFGLFEDILLAIFDAEEDFDKVLVEFEVEQLLVELDPILDAMGYVVPEYESKSVELEMSVQNDGTSQTKVVVGIEYI